MLVVKTKEIFLLNLHQNRVHFPAERHAFVLDHQHGRRDVTCKPAIRFRWLCIANFIYINTFYIPTNKNILGRCLSAGATNGLVAGRVQRKLDLGLNLEKRYIILITISCNAASSSSRLL